jgi:hypothetical protein
VHIMHLEKSSETLVLSDPQLVTLTKCGHVTPLSLRSALLSFIASPYTPLPYGFKAKVAYLRRNSCDRWSKSLLCTPD